MVCKHKNKLSLYGRGEKSWISTQKLSGNMIYVCEDCGAILEEKLIEKKTLKLNNKSLRNKTKDAFCEVKDE